MKWLMPYCIHNKHSSVCHLASHYNCDTLYVQKVDIFIVVRTQKFVFAKIFLENS